MKNNNSMTSLEVLIKNLKVLYQNLRGNTLPKIDKIKFQNNLVSNNKKKKYLLQFQLGDYLQC
tara:strand:- start:1886 stop:2074 length:189 start_codon:yes stop_codon:yes gene_type:complete